MKPTESFKLSKSAKRILATMPNNQQRAATKALFISAELEYERNKKISGKRREKDED